MEPERKIEKLLRAYAKKRRAKAGDSFKLHPATRRLLQGEVDRRKPAADDDDTSLSLWELFRTNWAVLAGFALIIFFCASFLVPVLNNTKNKARSLAAMSDLKQIGVAAQIAAADNHGRLPAALDALTNEIGSGLVLTDAVSGQRFVYLAGGEILDNLQTNTVLAYSPGDKKSHAVLFADGSVRQVRRGEFSTQTNHSVPNPTVAGLASSSMPAKTPATQPFPASAGRLSSARYLGGSATEAGGAGGERTSVHFKTKLATGSSQLNPGHLQPAAGLARAKSPPVLASFELRQSGNNVFILDRDGSIYKGTLQTAAGSEVAQNDSGISENQLALGPNYAFRVAGTNRTLNEQITFAGNLFTAAGTNTNATFYFQTGKSKGPQQEATNGWSAQQLPALRITGTITLNNTNQLKIIAVPATQ